MRTNQDKNRATEPYGELKRDSDGIKLKESKNKTSI